MTLINKETTVSEPAGETMYDCDQQGNKLQWNCCLWLL